MLGERWAPEAERVGADREARPCRRRLLTPSPGKKLRQNGEVRGWPHCAAGAAGGGRAGRLAYGLGAPPPYPLLGAGPPPAGPARS